MKFLSNKEKKDLIQKLPKGYDFEKKDEIKENDNILYKNNEKYLISINSNYYPHLKTINEKMFKSVFVDKGAIPFIINGADLMRPGIQKIEHEFKKNEIVLIKDENYNKLLALGTSLYDSKELEKQEKGKVISIYHYISDKYY